jgi:hypothetical protein
MFYYVTSLINTKGNHSVGVEEWIGMLKVVRSITACALSFYCVISREKSPEIGDYGKLRAQIPGLYRAIIFPSPDRLVRRHPVRVAESCVRSCNSVYLSPNFNIHVSVSGLYFPSIGPHIPCSRIGRPILEIYKSIFFLFF